MRLQFILEQHLAHGRGPRKQEPGRATQGSGAFTQVCGELALGQNQQLTLDSSNGLLSSRAVKTRGCACRCQARAASTLSGC